MTGAEKVQEQIKLKDSDQKAGELLKSMQGKVDEEKGKNEEDEKKQEEKIKEYLANHSETKSLEYLVRGAKLICSNGTHIRHLNLSKCHGVYIGEHPVVHEWDCVAGETENITWFGVCSPVGPDMPPGPNIMCVKTPENSKDGTTGNTQPGKKCQPIIIGTWMDTYDETRIVDNGEKDPSDRSAAEKGEKVKGRATVTVGSFLVCKYGGLIQPKESGQSQTNEDEPKKDGCSKDDCKLLHKYGGKGNKHGTKVLDPKYASITPTGKWDESKIKAGRWITQTLEEAGFEREFIAGVVGNVYNEGKFGLFESSAYKSNKPSYLVHMDDEHEYKEVSGKKISQVGIDALTNLQGSCEFSKTHRFGFGCVQWTDPDRISKLIEMYEKECPKGSYPTEDQCIKVEMEFMTYELTNTYKKVYSNWKENNEKKDNEIKVKQAAIDICTKYEKPSGYKTSEKQKPRIDKALEWYRAMENSEKDTKEKEGREGEEKEKKEEKEIFRNVNGWRK